MAGEIRVGEPRYAGEPLQQGDRGVQPEEDQGRGNPASEGGGGEARLRAGALLARDGLVQPEQEAGRAGASREIPVARSERLGSGDGERDTASSQVTAFENPEPEAPV